MLLVVVCRSGRRAGLSVRPAGGHHPRARRLHAASAAVEPVPVLRAGRVAGGVALGGHGFAPQASQRTLLRLTYLCVVVSRHLSQYRAWAETSGQQVQVRPCRTPREAEALRIRATIRGRGRAWASALARDGLVTACPRVLRVTAARTGAPSVALVRPHSDHPLLWARWIISNNASRAGPRRLPGDDEPSNPDKADRLAATRRHRGEVAAGSVRGRRRRRPPRRSPTGPGRSVVIDPRQGRRRAGRRSRGARPAAPGKAQARQPARQPTYRPSARRRPPPAG